MLWQLSCISSSQELFPEFLSRQIFCGNTKQGVEKVIFIYLTNYCLRFLF